MLTQDRYQAILQLLSEKGTVTVTELTKLLNTSESTVRRDLTALDEQGKLNKVFGGAISMHHNSIEDVNTMVLKSKLNVKEKNAIAQYAAKMINDFDCVYIDAGTTTKILINYIENSKATFVTNGIVHAKELVQKGFKAYIIGGKLKFSTEALIGAEGLNSLKKYNFSKCFLGTNGIDVKAGYSTIDVEEALVKGEAISRSFMSFILADHTKFGQVFPVTFGELKQACIITDRLADNKYSTHTVVKEVLL